MSYSDYSDFDPEENDGNSEKKLEVQQDLNIIKSAMNLVKMTMEKNEPFGKDIKLNYKKVLNGATMNSRLEISLPGRTMILEGTDLQDFASCSIVFLPTEEPRETEPFAQWSINTEE